MNGFLTVYNSCFLLRKVVIAMVMTLCISSVVIYIDFTTKFDIASTNLAVTRPQVDLYPKKSIVSDFITEAVEREVQKHDRLVVQGMSFILKLTPDDMALWKPVPSDTTQRIVCVNIFMKDRPIPYVDPLLMSLMIGQTPERLNSYFRINALNVERDPNRMAFPHLRETISQLPFIAMYNFSQAQGRFEDTVRSLEICLESTLPWCLLLDDDYIVPKGFVDQIEEFVIGRIPTGSREPVVVSLFSPSTHALWDYEQYKREVAISNAERRVYALPLYEPHFKMMRTNAKVPENGSGLFYSRRGVQVMLEYLKNPAADRGKSIGAHVEHVFPKHFQLEPSLVNHIGIYTDESKPKFDHMNTDIRFQFDAGI